MGCVHRIITNPLSNSSACVGIHQRASFSCQILHIHEYLHIKMRVLFAYGLKQDVGFPTVSVPQSRDLNGPPFLCTFLLSFLLMCQNIVSFLITFLLIMKIVRACCENWKMQNKNENTFHVLTFQLHFDVPTLLQSLLPQKMSGDCIYNFVLSFRCNVTIFTFYNVFRCFKMVFISWF